MISPRRCRGRSISISSRFRATSSDAGSGTSALSGPHAVGSCLRCRRARARAGARMVQCEPRRRRERGPGRVDPTRGGGLLEARRAPGRGRRDRHRRPRRAREAHRANAREGVRRGGAENLVFGKDESRRAEYLVGGTVRELQCRTKYNALSCRIGVEWQVLDVVRDEVVYEVISRASVLDRPADQKDRIAGLLLDRAMDSLLRRDRFRRALAEHAPAAASPVFPSRHDREVRARAKGRRERRRPARLRRGRPRARWLRQRGLRERGRPRRTAAHVVEGPT